MEENTYKQKFKVRYSEINDMYEITPVSLLNCLEETAINHSEEVGCGMSRLKTLGFGWILNRWRLEVDRYPNLDEEITVETWPCQFDRFYSTREFLIWDRSGKAIARASSTWILLNIERRRPIRVPEEISSAYKLNPVRAISEGAKDFKPMECYAESKEFDVRRRDIDTNRHVNNAVYVEWFMEGIPEDIYRNYFLSKLEIVYKKETTYGGTVFAHLQEGNKDENLAEYSHAVEDKSTGTNLVLGRTNWKSRGKDNL